MQKSTRCNNGLDIRDEDWGGMNVDSQVSGLIL